MDKAIKEFLNSQDFQKALKKVFQKYKISAPKQDLIKDIFKDLLEGKIILFALSNELEKRLKLDQNLAINVGLKLHSIYENLVPKELKENVQKKIELSKKLPSLPQVNVMNLDQLNSNYQESKKWFLNNETMPEAPDFSFPPPDIIDAQEINQILAEDPILAPSDFVYATGELMDREEKIKKLKVKLINKGIAEDKVLDLAEDLVKFVEAREKYLAVQKVLHRDILAELELIKVEQGEAKDFTWPKEIKKVMELKEKVDKSNLELLKKAVFKANSILKAYQKKLLAKNAKLNEAKLDYYEKALTNASEVLANKEINNEILAKISDIVKKSLLAIEAGLLFERPL